jgi:Sel1 repeat
MPTPTSEGKAKEVKAESASKVLADWTISNDRGMLVLRAAEPDQFLVSPRQRISHVAMRLCAIVGLAILVAAGLLWFSGLRQNANIAIRSDETSKEVGKVGTRSTSIVASPTAERDVAATIAKQVEASPSPAAPELAPTRGTPVPMQVAESSGKSEERSATRRPLATAPSLPAREVAQTPGTPTPMQVVKSNGNVEAGSATKVESELDHAPLMSGSMPRPALASKGPPQLNNDEIAMLVTRGKDFLNAHDLASARLLFQRAAAAGNTEATSILGTAQFGPPPQAAPTRATSEPASTLAPAASGMAPGPVLAHGGTTDNEEIAMLISRGKDFLKARDPASARLFFERAAASGSAEASFILGTTFDPLFIRRMGIVGMDPDIGRAREWYERAAALGSADASQQLANLQRRTGE